MKNYFCHKYGFNEQGIARRLQLLELSEGDLDTACILQDKVISTRLDKLVDEFYDYVLAQEPMVELLQGVDIKERMKTQRNYIETLGIRFNTNAYFEERLRVGFGHAQAQIPLPFYECAYYYLQDILVRAVEQVGGLSDAEKNRQRQFIRKITFLDMSLATDTYIYINVELLKQSISTLHNETQKLSSKLNIDKLTGLYSREYIFNQAEKLMVQSKEKVFSVILADIDLFKQINDTLGHAGGDVVLQSLALRLKGALRDIDLIGRIGGEEFLILLPNADEVVAGQVAERVRQTVAGKAVQFGDTAIDVTLSLGYAQVRETKFPALFERVDKALYLSKNLGRNQVSKG